MSQVVAIYWTDTALDYVVVKSGRVVAAGSVAKPTISSESELGAKLAEAVGSKFSGKARVVVALPRTAVQWQHLSLPPCPADELPDLVRMQAERDPTASDEDVGFDYLPLVGDEQHPQEVIAVNVSTPDLDAIRKACEAANLTVDSIVPLAIGLPMHAALSAAHASTTAQVYAAPLAAETTVWAVHAGKIVLLRQFPNASANDVESTAKSISNQLRRTLLTLSQNAEFAQPSISLADCGTLNSQALADQLGASLNRQITIIDAVAQQPGLSAADGYAPQHVPLASLAISISAGNPTLVDVLHPRRRPEPKINYRTYVLAAVAATLLVAALGWTAFTRLKSPLNIAAQDQAALDLLEESIDELAAYEKDAASIRNWLAESPNVLNHLNQLSKCMRPIGLDDENFVVSDDMLLEKLNLDKRQLVIDSVARGNQAVQPFESRLRLAEYSPQRGKSSVSKRDDYKWQFKTIIDIDAASDLAAQGTTDSPDIESAPDEEPES